MGSLCYAAGAKETDQYCSVIKMSMGRAEAASIEYYCSQQEGDLVVQDDVEEGAVDVKFAVVLNES
jgi:hypothetical protein